MCLALPVRVVQLLPDEQALVDLGGISKQISLALVDGVQVGDHVILHVGYALSKLNAAEAERTLALFAQGSQGPGLPSGVPSGLPTSMPMPQHTATQSATPEAA